MVTRAPARATRFGALDGFRLEQASANHRWHTRRILRVAERLPQGVRGFGLGCRLRVMIARLTSRPAWAGHVAAACLRGSEPCPVILA